MCWSGTAGGPDAAGSSGIAGQPMLPGFDRGQPVLPGIGPGGHRLVAWAGPWPMVERWWSATPRRRVHLQVALEGGRALLLSCSQGQWWCEALYD